MKLQEIKKLKEEKVSAAIADCGMFFAFSNEQFDKNKTPLNEGEKYTSIGGGAYMPSKNVSKWNDEMEDLEKWFQNEIKENKLQDEIILYELYNHEAFYTGDISDTVDALGGVYTEEEVMAVYRKNYHLQE